MEDKKGKKWDELGSFLAKRLKSPLKQPEFIFYFLFIVILVGGNGIWYTLWSENKNCVLNHNAIIVSLVSYSVALASSAAVDLVLSKVQDIRNTIIMLGVTLLLVSLLCFIAGVVIENTNIGYGFSVFSIIISLITWWIANSMRPDLNDEGEGSLEQNFNPMGGPIVPRTHEKEVDNINGNLAGLKV